MAARISSTDSSRVAIRGTGGRFGGGFGGTGAGMAMVLTESRNLSPIVHQTKAKIKSPIRRKYPRFVALGPMMLDGRRDLC